MPFPAKLPDFPPLNPQTFPYTLTSPISPPLTLPVPETAGGVVDEPAVAVHEVGHVVRLSGRGTGQGQGVSATGHPQLQTRRPRVGSRLPGQGLDALDLVEAAQMCWLE